MAVTRRPMGVDGDDEGDEVAEFFEDDGDVLPDLDRDSPPHLRALADAAHRGDVEALRLAIDGYSGSIDDPVEDGDTLLHLSCLYGHLPCVQLLLQWGANLESRDEEGAIPLHDACAGGFTEIVQLIFETAGNPDLINRMLNTVDAEGDTPLHHASRGEHLNVIRLLLATGASPKKTNIYGKIPAELADPGTEARSFLESSNVGHMASGGHCENRARWSDIHKVHLVKLLAQYNTPAYRSRNGWTKEAWNRILRDMMTKFFNTTYTMVQVKGLEQELKKTYKRLKGFTELSGFEWDYEKHVVSAPHDVWAPLLERNKEARRWHQKPFPYFLSLQKIYEGGCDEGKHSRGVEDYEEISKSPKEIFSPSIPAPNDPIQSLSTSEEDEVDSTEVESPCTQPSISQPQSSNSQRHRRIGDQDGQRRKRERKEANTQAFMEKFLAMRERETDQYINAMKAPEEKFTIGECIRAFNTIQNHFTDVEMFKATKLFMKDRSYREVFLCLMEDQRVSWLRSMFADL